MTNIELRPGMTPLAAWRAIYRGAKVVLDPVSRADVEAGRTALAAILARNGSLPPNDIGGSPSVAELVEKRGEPLPAGLLRLFVALKLGSLAQGVSGARWSVIEGLASFLSHDFLPVVPADHADDRIALSNLFGALTGTGEVLHHGHVQPAQKALKQAGIAPLTLNPRERRALLSGMELSVAAALAGLFEAERVFQSALVAAALSAAATHHDAGHHPRVYRLSRQSGQIEVAAIIRRLLGADGATASASEPQAHRGSEAQTLGACLDLLRQAASTLVRAANGVSEDQLVLWQTEELVEATADLSSVALAADQIALALRIVGDLSEVRIRSLALAQSDEPNAWMAGIEGKAAGFTAENRDRALPTALDPEGIWRLMPMAGTTALVIAIEFLGATSAAERSSATIPGGLDAVRRTVSDAARPASDKGAVAASNLASVAVLVGSGALAGASNVTLPSVSPPVSTESRSTPLGGRTKRT